MSFRLPLLGVLGLVSCNPDQHLCATDEQLNPYTDECEPRPGGGGGDGSADGGSSADDSGTASDTGADPDVGDGRGDLPDGAAYATVGMGRPLYPEEDGKLDCDEVQLSLAGDRGLLMAWSEEDELLAMAVVHSDADDCDVAMEESAVALGFLSAGGLFASPERARAVVAALGEQDAEVRAVATALADAGGVGAALEEEPSLSLGPLLRALVDASTHETAPPPPLPAASLDGAFSFIDYQITGSLESSRDYLSLTATLSPSAPSEFVLIGVEGAPALWLVPDGVPTSLAAGLMWRRLGLTPSLYTASDVGIYTIHGVEFVEESRPEIGLAAAAPAVPYSGPYSSLHDEAVLAQLAAATELLLTFGLSSEGLTLFGDGSCVEAISTDVTNALLVLLEQLQSGTLVSTGDLLFALLLEVAGLIEDALWSGDGAPSWLSVCGVPESDRLALVARAVGRLAFVVDASMVGIELGDMLIAYYSGPGVEEADWSACPFAGCDAGACGWRGDDLVCSDELYCSGSFTHVEADGTIVSFAGSVSCDVPIETLTVKLGDGETLWTTSGGSTSMSFSRSADAASSGVTGGTELGLWVKPTGAAAELVDVEDVSIEGACGDSGALACVGDDVWRVDDCGAVVGGSAEDDCTSTEECTEAGGTAWCATVDSGCDDYGWTECRWEDVWRVDACGDLVGSAAEDECSGVEECVETGTSAACVEPDEPGEPNLDPGTLSLSPDSGHAGRITMAYVDLTNEGDGDAASVEYAFYWSTDSTFGSGDEELYSSSTSLAAGETVSLDRAVTIPDDADEGRGYVLFVADPDDRIAESSETDNLASDAFDVEAPEDDAEAWGVTITESSADPGDEISLSTRVYNRGTAEITVTWGIYWSDNSTWSTADTLLYEETSSILPGRFDSFIDTVDIPTSADDGTGYVFLIADPDDSLAESDEDNNEARDSITVR